MNINELERFSYVFLSINNMLEGMSFSHSGDSVGIEIYTDFQ